MTIDHRNLERARTRFLFVTSTTVFSVLMLGWMWNGILVVIREMATMSGAGQAGAIVGAAFGLLILSSILILGNRALLLALKPAPRRIQESEKKALGDPEPRASKEYPDSE